MAYIRWEESCINDWIEQVKSEAQAPTDEQWQFLHRIIARCRTESQDFLHNTFFASDEKPVMDCLLGIPGAGKSKCIHLVRRFFEECLKMEEGVHFQFLASQNSMASLIGGRTLHTWAGISVNATAAFDKATAKADDGDISELFLNVQSIR